jgi:hypothetical protein
MDRKKISKITPDSEHQHRIKRLLQELEKEFDSLILENFQCKIKSIFFSYYLIKMIEVLT